MQQKWGFTVQVKKMVNFVNLVVSVIFFTQITISGRSRPCPDCQDRQCQGTNENDIIFNLLIDLILLCTFVKTESKSQFKIYFIESFKGFCYVTQISPKKIYKKV